MEKINEILIKLLSFSTCCDAPEDTIIELNSDEWQLLYNEALAHQIHLIIFAEANRYGSKNNSILFNKWKNITLLTALTHMGYLSNIGQLLDAFKTDGIEVMVLKGLYFKYLYREPDMRTMGDIDLYTKKESLSNAMNILQKHGYKKSMEDNDDPKHFKFFHDSFVPIELHFSLVTETKRKVASNFNDEIWKVVSYKRIDGIEFLVPSDVNQLIYCCIHMTNHLGKGGFGLRQLSDFNLLARNIVADEWNLVIEKAYIYGVGKFMEALLYLCHKLFNLELSSSVYSKFCSNEAFITKLIDVILESGVFGRKDKKSTLNRSLATYIKNENKSSVFNIRYLFPPRTNLSYDYAYAQKHPILLPIAWIHRLSNNIFRNDISLNDKIPNSKSIKEYVKLFKWLEIK